MKKPVLYFAVDVDDQAFHAHGVCPETGEVFSFSSRPSALALANKLKKHGGHGFELRVCYEATYLGFSLHRDLLAQSIACEVIDPGQIPRAAGPRVKTDRLDSRHMAELYAKGLLTVVYVPSAEDEAERDLIRARKFLVEQNKSLKNYILNLCKRSRIDYRAECGGEGGNYFTIAHRSWLKARVKALPGSSSALKTNLELLLAQLTSNESMIQNYDREIEGLSALPKYQKRVSSLTCYRGIQTQTAMTIITEVGSIARFSHPTKLMSYLGFDIAEYSSGGRERKFGITKMGNRHVRTAIVESCQTANRKPLLSKGLLQRRAAASRQQTEIADRCMKRLHAKAVKLLLREKNRNKVKVACAREMTAFIWESLRSASL